MEIPLLQFINNRSQEFQELQESFKKNDSKRQNKNNLPFHMRRRAKSHNIKRLPTRLQSTFALNTIGPKKPKRPSAMHRKRPKNFEARQTEYKWMETHVWHAKRFHNERLWGYKIPTASVSKGKRAAEKAVTRWCVLVDVSYYNCLEICGPKEAVFASMSRLMPDSVNNIQPFKETSHLVYKADSYPNHCMGPIRIACCQTSFRLWLWCHPSMVEAFKVELETVLKEHGLKAEVINLNRHRFLGPKSFNIIRSFLKPNVGESINERIWANDTVLLDETTLSLNVLDPRLCAPSSRTIYEMSPDLPSLTENEVLTLTDGNIWDANLRKRATDSKMPDHILSELRSQTLFYEPSSESVPVMVIKLSNEKGYDVIYPPGWSLPFYIAAVYSRAHVVGLRDLKRISSTPHFPDFFPDTQAGEEHQKWTTEKLQLDHSKRPPSKRTNFQHLGIDKPFTYDWKKVLGDECPVRVLRDEQLLANLNACLVARTPEQFKLETDFLIVVKVSAVAKGKPEAYGAILSPDTKEMMGYVEETGFTYCGVNTKGGFGHVKLSALLQLKDLIVLVQPHHSTCSREYHISVLTNKQVDL